MQTTIISVRPERQGAGWGLWLQWVLVLVVFMAGSVFVTDSLARPALTRAVSNSLAREVLIVLGLAILMALIGAAHWLVLRPYLAQAARWGAATAITLWIGGSLIELAFAAGIGQTASVVAGALLFGPACGIVQYFILQRQVRRAGWWVLAWTLGWPVLFAAAVAASGVIKLAFNVEGDSFLAVYYGAGAAVSGALTGGVLVWLLRQRGQAETPL